MIVVDASVLANSVADDGLPGHVARDAMRAGGDLTAPDLVDLETLSVLRRRWRTGLLSSDRFRLAAEDLADMPIARFPALPFLARAFELRENVTPYDAVYVALAERLGCPLVTADRRLTAAPGPRCEFHLLSV